MEHKFVRGDSLADNIDSIDLILQSWAPRLGNYITGIIPPVPIMHYQKLPDEDGIIYGGIIPLKGKISNAFFSIGKYNKKPLYVKIRILVNAIQSGVTLACDRSFNFYTPNITVDAGSLIKVSIEPITGGENFYIGILIQPDLEYCARDQQLIAGLKLLEEANNA